MFRQSSLVILFFGYIKLLPEDACYAGNIYSLCVHGTGACNLFMHDPVNPFKVKFVEESKSSRKTLERNKKFYGKILEN